MYSLAKDTKIKGLKDLVLKLGLNPKDVKVDEEIIRRRNVDIHKLMKQMKLHIGTPSSTRSGTTG